MGGTAGLADLSSGLDPQCANRLSSSERSLCTRKKLVSTFWVPSLSSDRLIYPKLETRNVELGALTRSYAL